MHDEQLHALLGDARARTVVAARRRRRWLARQLDEDRTFDDVFLAAVEAHSTVDVVVEGGRTYRGVPVVAGAEVTAVAPSTGATAYMARTAIIGMRVRAPASSSGVARDVITGATLSDVVGVLAERQAIVTLGIGAGGVYQGRIVGMGRDLLWFADGLHMRTAAITDAVPSG